MTKAKALRRILGLRNIFNELGSPSQFSKFLWYTFIMKNGDPDSLISFKIRSLEDSPVMLRRGTSDLIVLYQTFGNAYDRPPDFLPHDQVKRVWDLGSNVGLTMALYAVAYPNARVSGVELNPETADMARKNVRLFGPRCDVTTGAVWVEDGSVQYTITQGREYGAHIMESGTPLALASAPAWSLNRLLRDDSFVDLMKMDIEGAEQRVLCENTEWAAKVGCVKVECHDPYTPEAGREDLRRLGYTIWDHVSDNTVLGVRAH